MDALTFVFWGEVEVGNVGVFFGDASMELFDFFGVDRLVEIPGDFDVVFPEFLFSRVSRCYGGHFFHLKQ